MRSRPIALTAIVLSALFVASGAAPATQAGDTRVTIDNFSFAPAAIAVRVGTTVTWENRDDIPHTVTDAGQPRAFKSAALDTGDTFARVFSAPGTYHYFCSLHPHMQGTVVVK